MFLRPSGPERSMREPNERTVRITDHEPASHARRADGATMGGSAGDVAARSTGRAFEPRLCGAGRSSQPLVLDRGRLQFAHLHLAVCTRAITDAIAAAGLVRRCRRLWLPALVARGYDPHLAVVVAQPRRRHRSVAAAGYGRRAFPSHGNAGSLG